MRWKWFCRECHREGVIEVTDRAETGMVLLLAIEAHQKAGGGCAVQSLELKKIKRREINALRKWT